MPLIGGADSTQCGSRSHPKHAETRLVSLLLNHPEARERLRDMQCDTDLRHARVAGIVRTILETDVETGSVDYTTVLARLDDDEQRLLTRIAFTDVGATEADSIGDCVEALRRRRLRREGGEIQREIESTKAESVDELLDRKMKLARQIAQLEG